MKKYILPGVLVIFCSIIIYQTYSLKTIKDELGIVREELANTKVELQQDINSSIQNTLNEELGKSHMTKDVKFKFIKNQKEGYELNVRVEMKELKTDSKILFMYKDVNLNEWQELELNKISELSYIGDFLLPYDKSYEYKVVTKGITSESGDIETIEKSEFMPLSPECSWGYNETGIYFSSYPDTSTQEIDSKIKKLQVIVSHNQKEKTYNCNYKEEEAYGENNEVVDKFNYYELEIPKKDYNGKLDYIKMKVTYENGMIDIIDVTDNEMQSE